MNAKLIVLYRFALVYPNSPKVKTFKTLPFISENINM